MKCDVCGKREAAAVVTLRVNNKNTVRRVCAHCVKKLQRGDAYSAQMAVLSMMQPPAEEITCPLCGRTSTDLIRSGRVGCALCYRVFEPVIQPLAVRMNGAMQHTEAKPEEETPRNERAQRIAALRDEMFAAVNQEAYERAAQLRDEIRQLESENSGEE